MASRRWSRSEFTSATHIRTGKRFAFSRFNDDGGYAACGSVLRGFEMGIIGDVMPPNFFGGPGRTRTCNQTVMSAAPWREVRAKSAFLDQDHSRLCAFVHGVSAG